MSTYTSKFDEEGEETEEDEEEEDEEEKLAPLTKKELRDIKGRMYAFNTFCKIDCIQLLKGQRDVNLGIGGLLLKERVRIMQLPTTVRMRIAKKLKRLLPRDVTAPNASSATTSSSR